MSSSAKPARSEKRQRTFLVATRLLADENERINVAAAACGLSLSAFLREAALREAASVS